MKTFTLTLKLFLLITVTLIPFHGFSKCGLEPRCFYYPQYTSLPSSPLNTNFEIYVSINPGDSIIMVSEDNGFCPVSLNISPIWYYNDTLQLMGSVGNSNSNSTLIIAALPGVYKNSSAVFNARIHVSYATGFNEIHALSNFKIYPVPANNQLDISFMSLTSADYTFKLTNAFGSIVKEYILKNVIGEVKQTEDVSQLADGIYFLVIHNAEMVETRKFLKITGSKL